MSRKGMYLSELFLIELHEDYSIMAVQNAVHKCNSEFINRVSIGKRLGISNLSAYKQELLDFNDVYKEFDKELDCLGIKQFFIIQQLQSIIYLRK